MNLLIHYSPGALLTPGIPAQVAQYKIKDPNPTHEKYSLILRISNNIHQIPCLESVELQEEWVEEVKIPVKKDVPNPSPKPPAEGGADQKPADQEMKPED